MASYRPSLAVKVKMIDWLRSNWEEMQYKSNIELAAMLTEVVEFPIAGNSMDGYLRAAGVVRARKTFAKEVTITPHQLLLLCQEVRKIQGALVIAPSQGFVDMMKEL